MVTPFVNLSERNHPNTYVPNYSIFGRTADPYIPVQSAFEDYYKNGIDKNSQLCVFVGDQCVLDIHGKSDKAVGGGGAHGGVAGGKAAKGEVNSYNADSVTNIFSSGKSVSSVLMAIMVD